MNTKLNCGSQLEVNYLVSKIVTIQKLIPVHPANSPWHIPSKYIQFNMFTRIQRIQHWAMIMRAFLYYEVQVSETYLAM